MVSGDADGLPPMKSEVSQGNWGRWGPDDEVGSLNLISNEDVLSAAQLVESGQVVRLDQPISSKTPGSGHRAAISRFMDRTAGDYPAGHRGFAFCEDTVHYPAHSGTHVDALAHVWEDEHLYNGFPSSTIANRHGSSRCGIDKMPAVVGRGILVDLVGFRDGAYLAGGEEVDASLIEACLSWQGVEIFPGDSVLFRTGWWESQGQSAQYFDREPGPNLEAARWLVGRDVALVGADNYAFEAQPNSERFPVHRLLLRDHGTPIIEGLVLAELAQVVRGPFLFVMAPLPFVGSTASLVAPIAVL